MALPSTLQNFLTFLLTTRRTLLFLTTPPLLYLLLRTPRPRTRRPPSNIPLPRLPNPHLIATPHGHIQTHTWGPVQGPRVLLLHGISTPCAALAGLADALTRPTSTSSGCRVLLFDFLGRGRSDGTERGVRHDAALGAAQIKAVLEGVSRNGEVDWLDGKGMRVLGYSLGGGIAAEFVAKWEGRVNGLVLLEPAGLVRKERIAWESRMLCAGWLPWWAAEWVVGWRLKRDGFPRMTVPERLEMVIRGMGRESGDGKMEGGFMEAKNSEAKMWVEGGEGIVSPADAVTWQVDFHPGFVPGFISSMRYGPIHDGHKHWKNIGERCVRSREIKARGGEVRELEQGKVLVILGIHDAVILADETEEDARDAFGEENVEFVRVSGGPDLPWTQSERIAEAMKTFWVTSCA